MYGQHMRAWTYVTHRWNCLRTLRLYINFSPVKLPRSARPWFICCASAGCLSQSCCGTSLLKHSYLPNLWISGEPHRCVSDAFPALLIPYCCLSFLKQRISTCSSEHTCPLGWENRALTKNLLCKTHWKCSLHSFLFNWRVICTVLTAREP